MTMGEALNRGFNLLSCTALGIAGFAFAPEIITDDGWLARGDNAALLALGLFSLWWYSRHNNRFKKSLIPLVLVSIGLGIKLFGLIVAYGNQGEVSSNLVGVILFFGAVVALTQQYFKTQRLIESFNI